MTFDISGIHITLDGQIAAAKREAAMRRAVYARRVEDRKMSMDQACREIAAMEAILATLEALRKERAAA